MTQRQTTEAAPRAASPAAVRSKGSGRAHAAGHEQRDRRALRRLEKERDALLAEVEALRAERDAQVRDRAELCSALSHDLRNPLTVVVWSAQLLARRVAPEDAARRHLDSVARAAEELNQMLFELSDAARIPGQRLVQALELQPGELAALIEHATSFCRAEVQSKEVALELDVPAEASAITCDHDRMTRALAAVIAGAVRRSPKRGAVSVRAARLAEGGELRVVVEDAGPDIPPDDREAIFALPVAPAPGAPRRPRAVGTAVALFVARGVVEAHGGQLWMEPAEGRGARFVMTLPPPSEGVEVSPSSS